MFDLQTVASEPHATAKFWLGVADEIIKATAVFVGAAWTWINYQRSRTYAKKLELQVSGILLQKQDLYLVITTGLKNLGASKHLLQQEGTGCEIVAIRKDLSEIFVQLLPVFELQEWLEPGESIIDLKQCRVVMPSDDIVWLRANLRVVLGQVEWNSSCLVEVK
jgi:hypothetical protein